MAEPQPVPAVEFEDVALAYGRTTVLSGLRGVVPAGAGLVLLGPNGAGKSTLIKAVLGLVRVSAGTIRVLGCTPAEARRSVAYVPQADTLDAEFPVSAEQVVLMGRYRSVGWLRRPGRADRTAARAALEAVGLAERARDRFGLLSGGQRQRVLLARAICQHPDLLLLDEPFNGLDATSRDAVVETVTGLLSVGTAVVISTHDLMVATGFSQQVCLLGGPRPVLGTPERVLTAERMREAYRGNVLAVDGRLLIAS
jgi:manganese/iron transport system ATP-binding protein